MHAIFFFFFNDTATTEIYTLSLHDALPISYQRRAPLRLPLVPRNGCGRPGRAPERFLPLDITSLLLHVIFKGKKRSGAPVQQECRDRKSGSAGMPRPISYAVFCLKKKNSTGHGVGGCAVQAAGHDGPHTARST